MEKLKIKNISSTDFTDEFVSDDLALFKDASVAVVFFA